MGTEVPWTKDKIRNSREVREQMQQRFREALRDRPEPVLELRGSLDERTAAAIDAIDRHLGLRPPA
jgi:nicotinamide riboside kinase